ncbi:hypothetical protein LSCM1_06881 [Leishmania martiniquensis]|nr:hypothetical protein LSCM1_06881 [Leishmania martiniquensis]
MDRRLKLKEWPVENAAELTMVEARLTERAVEVAEAKLAAEAELRARYPNVAAAPGAAMLSSLALALDPQLAQLEQRRAVLAGQPKPDRAALRAAEAAAAARVQELMDEDADVEVEAAQARAAVLRQYPMCARDVTEAVGKDAMFASLAAQHAGLLSDPAANRTPLANVEGLMQERGSEVESGRRRRCRRQPANPPRLLDMNDVALESGELDDYHSRRHRHRRRRMLDAQEVPMDVAGEVHEQQDETAPVARSRHAATLRHSDPYYQELAALRASLVKEDEVVNADGIRCVEEQMKDRVAQLNSDAARAGAAEVRAVAVLQARYPFLGPTVTGETLTAAGLEDDAVFVGLAAEHAALKATPTAPRQALAFAEQQMRVRACELVAEHAREEEALRERLPFVGALPGGVVAARAGHGQRSGHEAATGAAGGAGQGPGVGAGAGGEATGEGDRRAGAPCCGGQDRAPSSPSGGRGGAARALPVPAGGAGAGYAARGGRCDGRPRVPHAGERAGGPAQKPGDQPAGAARRGGGAGVPRCRGGGGEAARDGGGAGALPVPVEARGGRATERGAAGAGRAVPGTGGAARAVAGESAHKRGKAAHDRGACSGPCARARGCQEQAGWSPRCRR